MSNFAYNYKREYYQNKIKNYKRSAVKIMNSKNINKFYDYDLDNTELNFQAALDLMKNHKCYIYNDLLTEEDSRSNGTNWLKFGFVQKGEKIHKYYYEIKELSHEVFFSDLEHYKNKLWKAKYLSNHSSYTLDPGEDYLPYAIQNKHIGSDFDNFLKINNIVLKRDINWAMKMLNAGKIMTREGNPKIYLFPPDKHDNTDVKISVEDLFAEDWQIFQLRTFKDVLDELHKGKSIRRKSWPVHWEVGEYSESVLIRYADLLAEDWEVVDVVAEVDRVQKDHMKERNERPNKNIE